MLTSSLDLILRALRTWQGIAILALGVVIIVTLVYKMFKERSPFKLIYILFTSVITLLLMMSSEPLWEHINMFYDWVYSMLS